MGPARRFVMFGGALSERQLEWLEEQLRTARRDGQRCIVFCHQPVRPASMLTLGADRLTTAASVAGTCTWLRGRCFQQG